jgi:hypothetical protein
MERLRPRKEFGVTLEQAIEYDSLREQYLTERHAAIRAGERIWKVRNFHWLDASEDEGPVLDYYSGARHRGFLEGTDAVGYDVYAMTREVDLADPLMRGPADEHRLIPYKLNTEMVETRRLAEIVLESYVEETAI